MVFYKLKSTAPNLSRGTTYLVNKASVHLVQMQIALSKNPSSFHVLSNSKISHELILKITAFIDGFKLNL